MPFFYLKSAFGNHSFASGLIFQQCLFLFLLYCPLYMLKEPSVEKPTKLSSSKQHFKLSWVECQLMSGKKFPTKSGAKLSGVIRKKSKPCWACCVNVRVRESNQKVNIWFKSWIFTLKNIVPASFPCYILFCRYGEYCYTVYYVDKIYGHEKPYRMQGHPRCGSCRGGRGMSDRSCAWLLVSWTMSSTWTISLSWEGVSHQPAGRRLWTDPAL